ncbi:unnamed protein product [Parnassius apollo]|uniref:(apollo) hypothetical protein n=1 Tax=Parnassius apollo TaxID=110799 RepID=A0A8S3X0Y9_PARAO|nr:unnamed protein product [Parnassius apollo]
MVIIRPLRPRLGKSSAKLVVAVVWCGALATAGPIPVVSEIQRPTDWHQVCKADICLEHWSSPNQSRQYTCALMILQFLLPLTALVYTYARIAHVVWGGRPPGEALSERDSRMQHSKRKVLWTIHEKDEEWATWPGMPYVWFASHWLAMSHCCYNPIIYCYMNAKYKRGYKQALSCLLCRIREPPTRFDHRYSVCEGIPLSELAGFNGTMRRGTSSSCMSRLHRAPTTTSTSCASTRRGQANVGSANNNLFLRTSNGSKHLIECSTGTLGVTPPVRAVSVRTHFN